MPAFADPSPPCRLLYLSYDGMTDPLGRSQVLPYLERLAAMGHNIRLLSLDKPDRLASDGAAIRARCAGAGIDWRALPFRSRPPVIAGWWNRWRLARSARAWLEERPADIVHARSDLAASAALDLCGRNGPKLLWDMRALWADERIDSGEWDTSKPLYRWLATHFRALQKQLIKRADGIVTLSEAGARWLASSGRSEKVTVIPCCADFDYFRADPAQRAERRAAIGVTGDQPLLLHLGSLGGNVLLDEMLDFLWVYRERHADAVMLFVAPDRHDIILAAARARDLDGAVRTVSATREEVPGWTAAADLGLFFVRPAPSKVAASPTKLGEMLATGLPVVTGPGIGDVEQIVADCRAGAVVAGFDERSYRKAIDALEEVPFDGTAIRQAAIRRFDVNEGARRYDRLYRVLMGRVG